MTTIAIKNGYIAADTIASRGDRIAGYMSKILDCGSTYFSGCGDAAAMQEFFQWASGYNKKATNWVESEDFTGIEFRNDGTLWSYERSTVPFQVLPITNHFAFGSGSHIATGAMEAGASAEEAVRIAAMYTFGTGGKIEVFKHENLVM